MPAYIGRPQLPNQLAQQLVKLASEQVDPLSVGLDKLGEILGGMSERHDKGRETAAAFQQKKELLAEKAAQDRITFQLKTLAGLQKAGVQTKKVGTSKPFLKGGGLVQQIGPTRKELQAQGFRSLGETLPKGYMVKGKAKPDIHVNLDDLDPADYPEIPAAAFGKGKSMSIGQLTGLKKTRTKLRKSLDALKKKYAGRKDGDVHAEARRLYKEDMEARKDAAFAKGDMFPTLPSGEEADELYMRTYVPRARKRLKGKLGPQEEKKYKKGDAFAEYMLTP